MATYRIANNEDGKDDGKDDGIYLRSSDVAFLLKVSPKTVSRWAKQGKLPYKRTLGGHRRFPEDGVRALARSLTHRAAQDDAGAAPDENPAENPAEAPGGEG